jgi:hypothetical protein
LDGVGSIKHYYEMEFALFSGIDFTQIRYINFVVEPSLVGSSSGTIILTTNGLFQ